MTLPNNDLGDDLLDKPVASSRRSTDGVSTGPKVLGPLASTAQVAACQLSNWYSKFSRTSGRRENMTIKSITLSGPEGFPPEGFREYLLTDGVQLPMGAEKLSSTAQTDGEWSSDDENEAQNDEDVNPTSPPFDFSILNQNLEEAIATLGGAVMPKLNWSAPKDATWVNGGSLKCQTPGDVYLLLKSSDFCLHDISFHAWNECSDYDAEQHTPPELELTLRKWCNLNPSMEFRCFVRQHELLAISQRHHSQHYPHLQADMPCIRDTILLFFEATVQHQFADGHQPNYVVDVYVDKKNRVWIMDFNIWARSTDPLLFDWEELQMLDDEDDPHFRVVETSLQVRHDPLASYRAPIDTVEIASMTGGDANQFEAFMKQCQKPSESDP